MDSQFTAGLTQAGPDGGREGGREGAKSSLTVTMVKRIPVLTP